MINIDPYLPIWAIIALVILAMGLSFLFLRYQWRAFIARILVIIAFTIFALNPIWQNEETDPSTDKLLLLLDQSLSQELGHREIWREKIDRELKSKFGQNANLEIIELGFGSDEETALMPILSQGLSQIAKDELAGVIIVSEGQFHDTPDLPRLNITAPVHFINASHNAEIDRQIELIAAPRYGVVKEDARISFKVTQNNVSARSKMSDRYAYVSLYLNGKIHYREPFEIGQEGTFNLPLKLAGDNMVELVVDDVADELTTQNNRLAFTIRGIHDRLRVMLVSGEPHAGQRVWRNLLKSDPAVDLVHFTILRPATKSDTASQEEMNLIRFPHLELFVYKIHEFDLVILDRYVMRGQLSPLHFDSIANFVEDGGALFVASGPEFSGRGSIALQQNLSFILPALPEGDATVTPFVASRTALGNRHPITRELSEENWGKWLRVMPSAINETGQVLLSGADHPLLVLDHVGKGRVAMLQSDQAWLWARGFDGGGPYGELLKRTTHWLLKEPSLDEESLKGEVIQRNGQDYLQVTRYSLYADIPDVTITTPNGDETSVSLTHLGEDSDAQQGIWQAEWPLPEKGTYQLQSKLFEANEEDAAIFQQGRAQADLNAVVIYGYDRSLEMQNVLGNGTLLNAEIRNWQADKSVNAAWHDVVANNTAQSQIDLPKIEWRANINGLDAGKLTLWRRNAEIVTAIEQKPILPLWGWMLLLVGISIAMWLVDYWRRGRV